MSDVGDAGRTSSVGRVGRGGKIGDAVAREILSRITRDGLTAGTRLPPEAQMMAEYRVGRSTLREALRILEVNGLIAIRPGPGGGPVVRDFSSHDFARTATLFLHARGLTVRELLEARLILEPVTARLAAQRRTSEEAARLGVAATAADPEAESEYRRATADFHALLVETAGNGVIGLLVLSLKDVFQTRVRELVVPGEDRAAVLRTHLQIADAVRDGRADDAGQLMSEHLADYVRRVEESHPGLMDEVVDWMQ
ncbi:FadR/GntR family transcriptional regulator [Kineosporia succinea]|uniref:DNA-binding FadR family transcriptional regulator n=1 Tax=Kineosporia succinea TaxID=84632 RepID=A0ABT9P684_9ACTN|nr:FCD domain-containing protein [Kineosporia succinea]MDP9828188.1 DNA-binding FadR family transcriptional regulator [Kineosporia succinea]